MARISTCFEFFRDIERLYWNCISQRMDRRKDLVRRNYRYFDYLSWLLILWTPACQSKNSHPWLTLAPEFLISVTSSKQCLHCDHSGNQAKWHHHYAAVRMCWTMHLSCFTKYGRISRFLFVISFPHIEQGTYRYLIYLTPLLIARNSCSNTHGAYLEYIRELFFFCKSSFLCTNNGQKHVIEPIPTHWNTHFNDSY